VISAPHDQYEHELIRVQQQTAGGSDVLRRQPKEGEKKKTDAPAAKFVNCDKDRLPVVQDAIEKAKALASRAVQAFEREYPLSYESAAMKAHFGSLGSDQKSTIIERYKKVLSNLGSKTYTCAKDNKEVKAGDQVVDLCGQASCPGNKITLFPVFGSKTCPAGPVMLHEAVHNEGGCDDINKGVVTRPQVPRIMLTLTSTLRWTLRRATRRRNQGSVSRRCRNLDYFPKLPAPPLK
jgi:hypothetical protein